MNQQEWLKRGWTVAALMVLAGCESSVSIDLTVEQPSDYEITETVLSVRGLEFRSSGGGTETIEFRDPESVLTFSYLDGQTLRLLTDEELSTGTYTGVRLLFDDDADESYVVRDNEELPLTIVAGDAYASINMQIEDDEDDEFSFTLVLDLRQSLRESADDEFTLTPVMRAVDTDEAGELAGIVEDDCSEEESFGEEAAIYLFAGNDVTPDDRDGTSPEPYATAGIFFETAQNRYTYFVPFLEPGNYTIALACRGDLDDPAEDNDLQFTSIDNIEIEDGEVLRYDVGS